MNALWIRQCSCLQHVYNHFLHPFITHINLGTADSNNYTLAILSQSNSKSKIASMKTSIWETVHSFQGSGIHLVRLACNIFASFRKLSCQRPGPGEHPSKTVAITSFSKNPGQVIDGANTSRIPSAGVTSATDIKSTQGRMTHL